MKLILFEKHDFYENEANNKEIFQFEDSEMLYAMSCGIY